MAKTCTLVCEDGRYTSNTGEILEEIRKAWMPVYDRHKASPPDFNIFRDISKATRSFLSSTIFVSRKRSDRFADIIDNDYMWLRDKSPRGGAGVAERCRERCCRIFPITFTEPSAQYTVDSTA